MRELHAVGATMSPKQWCLRHYEPSPCWDDDCSFVTGAGGEDEPHDSGAIAVTWLGDYRYQCVWVRSGANIGNWYPLGNEFGRPQTWADPRNELERMTSPAPEGRAPRNMVPLHPEWADLLDRGPVTVLAATNQKAYERGWAAGVRKARYAVDSQLEWLETEPE